MLRCLLVAAAIACLGCEPPADEPATKPTSAASGKPKSPKVAEAPPPWSASVEAALAALDAGLASDDQAAIRGATLWLSQQGAAAVGPCDAVVKNQAADVKSRLACLNVLGFLGPPAGSVILEATRSENPQVCRKAADALGGIQPSTSEIVTRLIELLDSDDSGLKRSAIESLGRIGKPANRATPQLQAILDSDAEESLRGAAKTALKKVDPRIRFRQE